jgi:ribulose 1,5-bisphosphate synthetase/thiazole synthase
LGEMLGEVGEVRRTFEELVKLVESDVYVGGGGGGG